MFSFGYPIMSLLNCVVLFMYGMQVFRKLEMIIDSLEDF